MKSFLLISIGLLLVSRALAAPAEVDPEDEGFEDESDEPVEEPVVNPVGRSENSDPVVPSSVVPAVAPPPVVPSEADPVVPEDKPVVEDKPLVVSERAAPQPVRPIFGRPGVRRTVVPVVPASAPVNPVSGRRVPTVGQQPGGSVYYASAPGGYGYGYRTYGYRTYPYNPYNVYQGQGHVTRTVVRAPGWLNTYGPRQVYDAQYPQEKVDEEPQVQEPAQIPQEPAQEPAQEPVQEEQKPAVQEPAVQEPAQQEDQQEEAQQEEVKEVKVEEKKEETKGGQQQEEEVKGGQEEDEQEESQEEAQQEEQKGSKDEAAKGVIRQETKSVVKEEAKPVVHQPTKTVIKEETKTVVKEETKSVRQPPTKTVIYEPPPTPKPVFQEPTKTVIKEETKGYRQPTKTFVHEPTQKPVVQEPTKTIIKEEPKVQQPTKTVVREETKITIHHPLPKPVVAVHQPTKTVIRQEPTKTIIKQEETKTVKEEPKPVQQPTKTVIREETKGHRREDPVKGFRQPQYPTKGIRQPPAKGGVIAGLHYGDIESLSHIVGGNRRLEDSDVPVVVPTVDKALDVPVDKVDDKVVGVSVYGSEGVNSAEVKPVVGSEVPVIGSPDLQDGSLFYVPKPRGQEGHSRVIQKVVVYASPERGYGPAYGGYAPFPFGYEYAYGPWNFPIRSGSIRPQYQLSPVVPVGADQKRAFSFPVSEGNIYEGSRGQAHYPTVVSSSVSNSGPQRFVIPNQDGWTTYSGYPVRYIPDVKPEIKPIVSAVDEEVKPVVSSEFVGRREVVSEVVKPEVVKPVEVKPVEVVPEEVKPVVYSPVVVPEVPVPRSVVPVVQPVPAPVVPYSPVSAPVVPGHYVSPGRRFRRGKVVGQVQS